MLRIAAALIVGMALATAAQARQPVTLVGPHLAQVRSFAQAQGNSLWPGYGGEPFGFLLVTDEEEILLCPDVVPAGFTPAGTDGATGCAYLTRPRSGMPNNLLAAMPLFGRPAVIVMGTPDSTGGSEPDWVRTILHEHFHQWQYGLPDYFGRTKALELHEGDESGMWMLNYAFPYDRADVVKAQAAASQALADALAARRTRDFYARFDAYIEHRRAFEAASGRDNWRYVELQLWQEGVARWTEIVLGKSYPDDEVAKSAAQLEERTLAALRSPDMPGQKREFVYAYGAGEAMLMEACGVEWRRRYPSLLELGTLLYGARVNCGRGS